MDTDNKEHYFPGQFLHQAALWDNIELLEDLLNGEDVNHLNTRDAWGRTALHAAAVSENTACLHKLLEAGADPNIACGLKGENRTPLHLAAIHGRIEALEHLLEANADIFARDSNGQTAFDLAESNRHPECAEILKCKADENEKKVQNFEKVLFDACSSNNLANAKNIVEALGVHMQEVLNYAPNGTYTILYRACEEGYLDIVQLLLDYGADCRIHPITCYSPLHISSSLGYKEICHLLLMKFPNLVQVLTVEKWLPIHAAILHAHGDIVDLLLKFPYPANILQKFNDKTNSWLYHFPFDINSKDGNNETPLFSACLGGHQGIVESLLKLKVKAISIQQSKRHVDDNDYYEQEDNSSGLKRSLSKLNLHKNPDEALISNTCSLSPVQLDLYCGTGETALYVAVKKRRHLIASMLLQQGADPNLPITMTEDDLMQSISNDLNIVGSNGLVEACKNNDEEMIELLLQYGARDDDQKALVVAMTMQHEIIVSKLLALKSYLDPEGKINKKAMEFLPQSRFSGGGVTYSSLFPTTSVMVNWHKMQCLCYIHEQWLVEASTSLNPKLQVSLDNPVTALFAITRLDISDNSVVEIPLCVFQLQSLRVLNAAQNKIERLGLPNGSTPSTPSSPKPRWCCPVLEEIHLEYNRLDYIPDALFDFPSLLHLDLSNNILQTMPFKMWTAPKLLELNLSLNLLTDLPIKPLTRSFEFHSSLRDSVNESLKNPDPVQGDYSGSTLRIADENNIFPDSESLDSDTSCLSNDCSNVAHLGNTHCIKMNTLHRENLWCNNITVNEGALDDEEISRDAKSQLTSLNISNNNFSAIPLGLPCLAPRLTRLNLAHNIISHMGAINNLPSSLKQLDLSYNQLKFWPTLPKLPLENMIDNNLTTCYSPNAETNASRTRPLSPLLPLRKPGGSFTRTSRSSSMSSVSSQNFNQSFCPHLRHWRMKNLRTLILNDNQLDRIVVIWDNEEEDLEAGFHTVSKEPCPPNSPINTSNRTNVLWPNLSMLDISNNKVKEIPSKIKELHNLSVLNVSGNYEIAQLCPDMGLLTKLWNLNTRGCCLNEPLKSMIESKKYKTMDIIGYLKSILEDAKPYARMKLMIVGIQGIGKTSLLEQLRLEGSGSYKKKQVEGWAKRMGNKNINQKTAKGTNISTVGVDVGDWTYDKKIKNQSSYGPVIFRTWDFGGQKEYYATHQYFLSKRSLYLVVWKISSGEIGVNQILQWLVNIQARAPNSPVLIVGTHYDEVKEKKFPPMFSEDLQQLIREKFINIVDPDKCGLPHVIDTIEVSCKTKHNIKQLCHLIYDTVFELRPPGSKERLLEQKIPATYLALEDVIAHLAMERRNQGKDPVLRAEPYKMLVMVTMKNHFEMEFRDMAELNQATTFLHENGVLLHYEDATLKDLYFLDPQWLCDMLAHVVTIREINPFARNGVMKIDDLKHVFKASSSASINIKSYILNLLNKFEVALTWDNRTLLIPSLLPTEEQIRSGLPNCDFRIPVKAKGWGIHLKVHLTKTTSLGNSAFYLPLDGSDELAKSSSSELSIREQCNIARSHSIEMPGFIITHRNNPGISIRRLYLMSYFPSGFWSRLVTRILADESMTSIIRNVFEIPEYLLTDESIMAVFDARAEWICWQTGMELKYVGTTLFRMKEVLPDLIDSTCDYRRLRFSLQQEGCPDNWVDININNSSILEILLPNHLLVIKRQGNSQQSPAIFVEPNPEQITKFLAAATDHVDTLLEDWYPLLGTRFVHTSEGKFLVTRLVPCTSCLLTAFKQDPSDDMWEVVDVDARKKEALVSQTVLLPKQNIPNCNQKSRSLTSSSVVSLGTDRGSTGSSTSLDSGVGRESSQSSREISYDENCLVLDNICSNDRPDCVPSVFAFTIEQCILMSHRDKNVRCPTHGDIGLDKIAPDMVFVDLGDKYLIRPDHVKRGKMLGRGAFGFVFKASVKQKRTRHFIDVAMKMLQPVDPGFGASHSAIAAYKATSGKWDRDPLQHACKAYLTARQELSILLSLKHPNIVPLLGVCTQPLSLVLCLAPLGALDDILKNYRRSGARLHLNVLQKILVQVAKALEYLHQQHIIYRDLKSENVLVWNMPPPFHTHPSPPVEIKLADYGISRSTLPTGTKGFAGTEGFMAPEIVRYNGEEEYTDKVDCFSFGMFMFETITLHLPFEGSEQVKDSILDGKRPNLTQRELANPSYLLDLMITCWSQQPNERPSASQIVSIATAPEFCHLLDVVSLDEPMAVVSAEAVQLQDEACSELIVAKVESGPLSQTDVWLSRQGCQLDVLTCNHQAWLEYKTLDIQGISITTVCAVESTVWLGDTKGVIHIYSVNSHSEVHHIEVGQPVAIRNMVYIPEIQIVVVSLSNSCLMVCIVNFSQLDQISIEKMVWNAKPILCMAALACDNKNCEVWCGQGQGSIAIYTFMDLELKLEEINHYEPIVENLDVFHLVTCSHDTKSVWSYVNPGCIVYHWDASTRTILNKLDCSKLAPVSESIRSISIDEHLSPGRCQVTAITILDKEMYIGTTWGCIIVVENKSMRPITVFRPYEEEVKAILPVKPHISSNQSSDLTRNGQNISPAIISIGKGYRSLVGRYTNMQPVQQSKSKPQMYVILWRAEQWSSA